jgi:predicted GNAT superfamily acetyltransferase
MVYNMGRLRLKGVAGNIPFDCPAESPEWMTNMELKEVIKRGDGKIEAINYHADYGHGFGKPNETEVIQLHIGEKISFLHWYVDTEDGTWNDGCFTVTVELVEE